MQSLGGYLPRPPSVVCDRTGLVVSLTTLRLLYRSVCARCPPPALVRRQRMAVRHPEEARQSEKLTPTLRSTSNLILQALFQSSGLINNQSTIWMSCQSLETSLVDRRLKFRMLKLELS